MLLGPVDGFMVGFIGTGIYQLLSYGITVGKPVLFMYLEFDGKAMKKCGVSEGKRKEVLRKVLDEVVNCP